MILRLKSENFLRTRVLAVFGPMAPLAKGDDDADYEDEVVKPRRKRARPAQGVLYPRLRRGRAHPPTTGAGRARQAQGAWGRLSRRRARRGRNPRPRNSTKIALEPLQYYLRSLYDRHRIARPEIVPARPRPAPGQWRTETTHTGRPDDPPGRRHPRLRPPGPLVARSGRFRAALSSSPSRVFEVKRGDRSTDHGIPACRSGQLTPVDLVGVRKCTFHAPGS